MKKTSKILALVLVVAMVVAMGVGTVAFAATGDNLFTYTGADKDSGSSIKLSNSTEGTTYALYKIFDATFTGEKVSYTIPAGALKDELSTAAWADYVTISATADANGNFSVARKMNGEDPVKTDAEFLTQIQTLDTDLLTSIGSITSAANGEIEWKDLPYGYYMIVPDKPTEPKAAVTIDSNVPTVEVIDKNSTPSWDNGDNKPGKVIVTNPGANPEQTTTVNEAMLGEDVTFDIGVEATNHNGDKEILEYYIYDTMDNGMTYKSGEGKFVVKVVDKEKNTTTTLNPYSASNTNGYTVTYYDKDGAVTTDLAAAQSFKVKVPWATTKTEDGKTVFDEFIYGSPAEIHVRYVAFLDPAKPDSVNIGTTAGNKNTADFDWKDVGDKTTEPDKKNPNHDVPDKDTKTYTTSVTIQKTDGSKELKGAEFQLVGQSTNVVITMTESFTAWVEGTSTGDKYWKLANGTYTKDNPATLKDDGSGELLYDQTLYADTTTVYAKTTTVGTIGNGTSAVDITAFVNEDGTLTFAGLGAGTYTIKETTVPAGYNKADDITFTISTEDVDTTNKTLKFKSSNANVVLDATNGVFNVEIVNNSGSELPETGGIGTTIFYVVGAILVVGAVVILVTRRRMRAR